MLEQVQRSNVNVYQNLCPNPPTEKWEKHIPRFWTPSMYSTKVGSVGHACFCICVNFLWFMDKQPAWNPQHKLTVASYPETPGYEAKAYCPIESSLWTWNDCGTIVVWMEIDFSTDNTKGNEIGAIEWNFIMCASKRNIHQFYSIHSSERQQFTIIPAPPSYPDSGSLSCYYY